MNLEIRFRIVPIFSRLIFKVRSLAPAAKRYAAYQSATAFNSVTERSGLHDATLTIFAFAAMMKAPSSSSVFTVPVMDRILSPLAWIDIFHPYLSAPGNLPSFDAASASAFSALSARLVSAARAFSASFAAPARAFSASSARLVSAFNSP